MYTIPCVIARGGTSKGVFLNERDLPEDPGMRDRMISKLFGSPDARQIDGLGGADPLTSKVAILARPSSDAYHVEYWSGEVRLNSTEVNYGIMCGNLAAAVGPAALALGLLDTGFCEHPLKIFNRNSKTVIGAKFSPELPACPGESLDVTLIFDRPVGQATGKLLPTGNIIDQIKINSHSLETTIVDAGAIYAFFPAPYFGFEGDETPELLDSKSEFKALIEKLRSRVKDTICLAGSSVHTGQVKIALVSTPGKSDAAVGASPQPVIAGRIINPLKTHRAYAVSGAIATCISAFIKGSVTNRLALPEKKVDQFIISHPEGTLQVGLELPETQSIDLACLAATSNAQVARSARLLLRGESYVEL